DVLLTALLRAHTRWSGKSVLAIELEGHGREEILEGIDVSRTVGWFTAAFPVVLEEQENSSLCDTLKSVKERLRAIPNRGLGHGMLRYLRGERQIEEELRGLPQPDIGFNYLGQLDQSLFESTLLKVSSVRCGALRSQRARRTHLLDVVGALIDRRLQITFTYSCNHSSADSVESFATGFLAELRLLIASCRRVVRAIRTPSDFPLVQIDPAQLDQLIATSDGIEELYPLSPIQQGMLFHSLISPQRDVYVGQLQFTLAGELELPAFEKAWQQAIEKHECLRAAFCWQDLEAPIQVVHKNVLIEPSYHDWSDCSLEQQQLMLDSLSEAERRAGFALMAPPLMRLALVRLSPQSWRCMWTHHQL